MTRKIKVNYARFHSDGRLSDSVKIYFWNIQDILLTMNSQRDVQEEYLRLRGQMLYVHEWKAIIYLATPVYVFRLEGIS